jgi:glycosyltransferase involved in cell wall biosynthesis
MTLPLSVVIIAKNEQARIKECLESVYGWSDDIVVLDDVSTDNTREIASRFTDKIFIRHMELEGKQRNFGASKVKNDWVMLLDCDERLTEELKNEIAVVLKEGDPKIAAYWAPQVNYIGGAQLNHGGWSNPHIRLYNKNYVKWSEADFDVIHPGLKFAEDYRGGNLKGKTIHYSFPDVENFIAKINRYSTLEAIKWHLDGRKMTTTKAMWRSWDRFFRRFIAKQEYKGGFYSFLAAALSRLHEFFAYVKC